MKTESTIFDLLRELRESSTVELKASHKELDRKSPKSFGLRIQLFVTQMVELFF